MADASAQGWDHTVDVLVVGSGAGAMAAAITAYDRGAGTLMIEKGSQYGGSSAMSGGGLWVPNNPLMAGAGMQDSPEDALAYLKATTRGLVSEDRLQAFIKYGPEAVRYLTEHTRLKLDVLTEYPDYYPGSPGYRAGGRAMEGVRFDARELGEEFLKMRESAIQSLIAGRIFMTIKEARTLMCHGPGWIALMIKLMARYWLDLPWRLSSKRDRSLTMGNALIAMLRRSMMDRGIPLWLNTPAREFVVENGRVVGVAAEKNGQHIRIRAEKGVIVGAGGFESNQEMRQKYLPNPTRAEWTCANPWNTGDIIRMGTAIGAGIDLMDDAWWGPTVVVPGEDRARMLVIEKSLPGSILVNKRGRRYVNEALPYVDVVNAMYANNKPEAPSVPSYLIFDATFRYKYPVGPMLQGQAQPDWALPKRVKNEFMKKSDTIEGLAAIYGVDATGLEETVAKVNTYARTGIDLDFHRGDTVFDRYYGDEKVTPNPCLAPIEKPPFYILEAFPGELGTKGGLKTNANAQVMKDSGEVIPGLYAIGNCAASITGRTYPGPGSTLGPAATFGYIAARHAVGT